MDYKEALEYIDGARWFGKEPSLRRIRELMELLGNPQKKLKFIHIAGTNGKGSCAAMLASILRVSGYRTGLYTSPYLYRFNERIQVNGREISDEALAECVSAVKERAEKMEEHPTEFELMTAAAFIFFLSEKCDIVVLETGLGGRFDATNIIDPPECAVIMNIGLDHTAILGNTLEAIAAEKAGIIKEGSPCVVYEQAESVMEVFREKCSAVGSRLVSPDFSKISPEFDSIEGQVFSYKGENYALSLLGAHQRKNAAAVIETVKLLRDRGWSIEDDSIEHGLYAALWPGRFELCSEEPLFIVDGGHNPQCARTVADSLMSYFADKRRIILIGVLKDKDYEAIADILNTAADEYICVTPDSPRALDAAKLGELLEKYGKPVSVCASIADGVELAKEMSDENTVVCAVGSLYLAGSVRYQLGMY